MIWTWGIVHSTPALSFETHSGIQEKLAAYIIENIKAKRPTASNIVVDKMWTEPLDENKVRAVYMYSFKEVGESGPLSTQINGEAILEHTPDDGSGQDHWVIKKMQNSSDAIEFDEATLVTGSADSAPAAGGESHPEAPAENHQ